MDFFINTLDEALAIQQRYEADFHKEELPPNVTHIINYQNKNWCKIAQFSRTIEGCNARIKLALQALWAVISCEWWTSPQHFKDKWTSAFTWKQIRVIYVDETIVDLLKKKVTLDTIKPQQQQVIPRQTSVIDQTQNLPSQKGLTPSNPPPNLPARTEASPPCLIQEALPPEIKTYMLQFLSEEALATLAVTSKEWKTIIEEDKKLHQRLNSYKTELLKIQNEIPNIRRDGRQLLKQLIQEFNLDYICQIFETNPSVYSMKSNAYFYMFLVPSAGYHVSGLKHSRQWCIRAVNLTREEKMMNSSSCSNLNIDKLWTCSVRFNEDHKKNLISLLESKTIELSQKIYAKQLEMHFNFIAERAWRKYSKQTEFKKNIEKNIRFIPHRLLWLKEFIRYLNEDKDLIFCYLDDKRDVQLVQKTLELQKKRVTALKEHQEQQDQRSNQRFEQQFNNIFTLKQTV